MLDLDGHRYLVAPRGDTEWVRNLRAAGRGEIRSRGRATLFAAIDIAVAERPPIIAAYRQRWDGQVRAQFEQFPDAADHPVFRLDAT